MAQAVFPSPIKEEQGETLALATTAKCIGILPGFQEVKIYCPSQWRMALGPKLLHCVYFNGTTYTDYVTNVTDRVSTTHLPLDGMTTAHYLYLGTTAIPRGFYFDIGTNVQDEAATLDMEYCYAEPKQLDIRLTGTESAGFTVGESVSGTGGASGTVVYDGTTYIVVTSVTGTFLTTDTVTGASSGSTLSTITAIAYDTSTAFFTDVAGDSDGTNSVADTLKVDGLYTFTVPAIIESRLGTALAPIFSKCYWVRFKPSATLSTTVDINEIVPLYKNATYGYHEGGIEYGPFSLNTAEVGGLELAATAGTPTANITWIKH